MKDGRDPSVLWRMLAGGLRGSERSKDRFEIWGRSCWQPGIVRVPWIYHVGRQVANIVIEVNDLVCRHILVVENLAIVGSGSGIADLRLASDPHEFRPNWTEKTKTAIAIASTIEHPSKPSDEVVILPSIILLASCNTLDNVLEAGDACKC